MISLFPALNQEPLPSSRPVAALPLPWTIQYALRAEDIQFEAQLARIPDRYLLKIPSIGPKAVQRIRVVVPFCEVSE